MHQQILQSLTSVPLHTGFCSGVGHGASSSTTEQVIDAVPVRTKPSSQLNVATLPFMSPSLLLMSPFPISTGNPVHRGPHVGRPVYEYHRSHCSLWWYGFPVDATAVANAQSHNKCTLLMSLSLPPITRTSKNNVNKSMSN